jgi:hypothetical protein
VNILDSSAGTAGPVPVKPIKAFFPEKQADSTGKATAFHLIRRIRKARVILSGGSA